jgi:glycosyltransferase involved in cell wall biosynthesis
MNLLYFTTAYEHGITGNPLHEELLARLIDAGHTATVLVPAPRRRAGARLLVEQGSPPVVRAAVSATLADRAANRLSGQVFHYDYFVNSVRAYRDYLRRHPEIDVVHIESVYPMGAVAALAGDSRPFIPTIRGGDLISEDALGYGFARFRSARTLIRLTFERAALVRAVSPGGREMAIQCGCPPEKIVVVPRNLRDDYFVDDVPAFRVEKRQLIEERHGLAGRTIILSAGRLLPIKGFDDLIRALPAVLERIPSATVLICGGNRIDEQFGDYAAYLRRMAEEHGVGERFILVGDVPFQQMRDYFAAADVVAIPSIMEGGNKILSEAALFGTPFVATDTAGTIGFFDERHGVGIPVRNPERLASALIELLADHAAWYKRSAALLEGRMRFHSTTVARELSAVYQQTVAQGKRQKVKGKQREARIRDQGSGIRGVNRQTGNEPRTTDHRPPTTDHRPPTICYIAYPTSLQLRSANAIQTWSTLRALRALHPDLLTLIARWEGGPSRFDEVGALHLPRPAIGRLSRLYRSTLWYYAERSVFAAMCAGVLAWRKARGQQFAAMYVREVICAAWWAALWGPMLGIPVVYEAHDLESWNPSRAKERWAQPLLNLIDRLALSRAAQVTSLTEEFRQLLARLGWQAAERMSVVPDGYDDAQYFPQDRATCRRELGMADDALLIVYTGLTFAYRGLDKLIDAVATLSQTYPTLRLALIGGRAQEVAALAEQARTRGIADRVLLTGQLPQERTPIYLGAADLLVIPDTVTDVTASPLKLFEYMAAGRAVVLPDLPALQEILPPDIGWYFRRGDTQALTTALADALGDAARREAAGQQSIALVQDYTYSARACRILNILNRVSGRSQIEISQDVL